MQQVEIDPSSIQEVACLNVKQCFCSVVVVVVKKVLFEWQQNTSQNHWIQIIQCLKWEH